MHEFTTRSNTRPCEPQEQVPTWQQIIGMSHKAEWIFEGLHFYALLCLSQLLYQAVAQDELKHNRVGLSVSRD